MIGMHVRLDHVAHQKAALAQQGLVWPHIQRRVYDRRFVRLTRRHHIGRAPVPFIKKLFEVHGMDSFVSLLLSIRNFSERDRILDHVIDLRTIRSALIPSLVKDLSIITRSNSSKRPLYLPFLALTGRSLCSVTCVKPTPTSHSWYCENV